MRTHLMAGTALVAATMLAGGALAADKKMMKPSISVNGYYEGVVGGILDDTQDKTYSWMAVDLDGTPGVADYTEDPDTRTRRLWIPGRTRRSTSTAGRRSTAA